MIRLSYNGRAPLDNIRTLSVFRDGKNMGIELRITIIYPKLDSCVPA